MKKTIKVDEYGPYIQTNSSIYRPQRSNRAYVCTYDMERGNSTTFKDGDKVDAHMVAQTPFASVRTPEHDHEEVWYTHGQRFTFGYSGAQTTDCWDPREEEEN
jgi:hypothetical protein